MPLNTFMSTLWFIPGNLPFSVRYINGPSVMRCSRGNLLLSAQYGSDALRLWMSFIGEYSESVTWSEEGLKACNKLINRIWNIQEMVAGYGETKELRYAVNAAIKKVDADIDATKFNTAISAVMILVNEVYKVGKITNDEYKKLILLISPFAPHLASELFEVMGYGKYEDSIWPEIDESALIQDEIEIPIQVNGKLRGKILVSKDATEEEIKQLAQEEVKDYITSGVKKIIYIPGRIFNIVV